MTGNPDAPAVRTGLTAAGVGEEVTEVVEVGLNPFHRWTGEVLGTNLGLNLSL